jgi:hypothetical protein
MDDFDDISEEEQRLAAELKELLEGSRHDSDDLVELEPQLALLKNFDHFELSASALNRGRADVEKQALVSRATGGATAKARRRWFYFLPASAVAAAALAMGLLSRSTTDRVDPVATYATDSELPHAPSPVSPSKRSPLAKNSANRSAADDEADFAKLAPRYHAGETPRALLHAQAAVLARREPGKAKQDARQEFERQMRAYRGQLIASIELGGRE